MPWNRYPSWDSRTAVTTPATSPSPAWRSFRTRVASHDTMSFPSLADRGRTTPVPHTAQEGYRHDVDVDRAAAVGARRSGTRSPTPSARGSAPVRRRAPLREAGPGVSRSPDAQAKRRDVDEHTPGRDIEPGRTGAVRRRGRARAAVPPPCRGAGRGDAGRRGRPPHHQRRRVSVRPLGTPRAFGGGADGLGRSDGSTDPVGRIPAPESLANNPDQVWCEGHFDAVGGGPERSGPTRRAPQAPVRSQDHKTWQEITPPMWIEADAWPHRNEVVEEVRDSGETEGKYLGLETTN